MSGFFEEIKRRKVYRVAVAYAVVAAGAIQLSSAVFPAWELPFWALRQVIICLLIGFPISLILAWGPGSGFCIGRPNSVQVSSRRERLSEFGPQARGFYQSCGYIAGRS